MYSIYKCIRVILSAIPPRLYKPHPGKVLIDILELFAQKKSVLI